jgi:photosystem II stability/assembly factor-like uncharacterized protein
MRSIVRASLRLPTMLVLLGVAVLAPSFASPAVASSAAGVPDGFKANSISWLNPRQGWILGNAPCGSTKCTYVISTRDSGASWQLVGQVPAGIPIIGNPGTGVTEVRFATRALGWAFAPQLYQTTDGGRTWHQQTIPGGRQVLWLASGRGTTYAVVSPCRWATGICTHRLPLTLWMTHDGPNPTWTQIPLDLPISVAANIAVYGRTVYVVDTQEDSPNDLLYASLDGVHFSSRPVPCEDPQDTDLLQAVPTSRTDVSVLCDGDPGFSKSVKTVWRSTDTGRTYTSAGMAGLFGIQSQLAASPSGNLAIASWSDGSFIYINDGGGTTWTQIIGSGDGGAGWNDVVYTTNEDAWVVFGPADFFADYGVVYVTHDAGHTWNPVTL